MILVDVYVPSTDTTYDFQLDENARVDKIICELVDIIGKKMKREGLNPDSFLLYDVEREEELLREESLASCGVRDGNRLLLV